MQNRGVFVRNDLQVALQNRCKRCGLALNGPDRGKILLAVKLYGLKPGYRLCRCSQTIFDAKGNAIDCQIDDWQEVRSIKKSKIKNGPK